MSETSGTNQHNNWGARLSTAADALEAAKAALDMAKTEEERKYILDQCVTLDREYRQLLNQRSAEQWQANIGASLLRADLSRDFLTNVVLSEPLKAMLNRYKEVTDAVADAAIDEFDRLNPEGIHDKRDFSEMIGFDPSWDDEYCKAYGRNYVRDYFSGEQGRTHTLNEFYDRLDAVDVFSLDLSCLQGNDNGPRSGEDNLTQSERDFMSLLSLFRANQTFGTKAKENPGYLEARYPTPQAMAKLELTQDLLITWGMNNYLSMVPLANNGYAQNLEQIQPINQIMPITAVSPSIARQMYFQHMATLHGMEIDRSLKFKIPDVCGKGLYGMLHRKGGIPSLSAESGAILGSIHNSMAAQRYMQETGTTIEDMYFIDGKSLREIGDEKYRRLTPENRVEQLKKDLMVAMFSGEHRIEAATIQLAPNGTYTVQVSSLQPDLHCMDEPTKQSRSSLRRLFDFGLTKIETPASKADKLWANDPDREARQKAIKNNMIARIMEGANRKLQANLRSEENRRTFEALNEKAKILHAAELQDLISVKENADQAVRDVISRNHDSEVRIGQIMQEQRRVDAFRTACRRHDMLTQRIDTLRGVTNDDTDINIQNLDNVLNSIPVDMKNSDANAIHQIVNSEAMPAFRRLEFACELLAQESPDMRQKYMAGKKVADSFTKEDIDILCGDDAEKREALLEQLREDFRKPLRSLIDKFGTALLAMPVAQSDVLEKDEERKAEIQTLRSQLEPVTQEMRFAQIEAEAAILDGRELLADDLTKDKLYQGYPNDYTPPQTRQEALERIAAIDEKNALYLRHYEERLKVQNGKELFSMGFDREQPVFKTQQDIKDTITYMESLQLPMDQLSNDMQHAYKETIKDLLKIANQPSLNKIPDRLDDLTNTLFQLCQLSVDSKPEYAALNISSSQEVHQHNHDMHTRQCLMDNLRDFDKELRLENMAKSRNLIYPPAPARAAIDLEQLPNRQPQQDVQRERSASVSHADPELKAQLEKDGRSNTF